MKRTLALLIVSIILIGAFITASTNVVDLQDPIPASYGEMEGMNAIVDIVSSGVYVNVTNINISHIAGMENLSNAFVITFDGFYSVNSAMSFSGNANTEYHLAMGTNGEKIGHCHAERKIGTGGDVGSAGFTCIDYFEKGDVITLMMENADTSTDPTLHDVNLNIVRIPNA